MDKVSRLRCLVVSVVILAVVLSGCASHSLNGSYGMSMNHTIDFKADGTCIMQDNGVSWPGSYEYEAITDSYEITINAAFGTVEAYTAKQDGTNLIISNGNSSFTYEKMQ